MKTILSLFCCLLVSFNLLSQNLEHDSGDDIKQIKASTKPHQLLKSNTIFEGFISISYQPLQIGLFKIKPVTLSQKLNLHAEKKQEVNILAIAKAQEHYKQSQIRDFKMPIRQLRQIRSSVQIMIQRQSSVWDRSNNNLNFYGNNRKPDNGIRNTAYEEIQRSVYTPQFSPFGWGYSPYSYRPRGGFYRR